MSVPRSSLTTGLVCLALGLAACGGDDADQSSKSPAKAATPAQGQTTSAKAPALSQDQIAQIQIGMPKAQVQQIAGQALPIEDYALNAQDRASCEYHPLKTSYGRVDYDNVWRFCFKGGKLLSLSTAPSRKAAGPDAGAPSPKKAGGAITKPGKG